MNRQAILKRMIILCWILLVVCFIVKLFGGNWFEIIVANEKFIAVCDFVDKNIFVKYALSYCLFVVSFSYIVLSTLQIKIFNKKETIIVVIILTLYWCFKTFIKINFIAYLIIDFLLLFIILYGVSLDIKNTILNMILNFMFITISMFTKNLSFNNKIDPSTLISIIYLLDYYIMVLLNYYYRIRRNESMGMFGWLWLSSDVAQLKAFKETCKSAKDKEKVQKRIDKLEAKQKNAKV